MGYMIKSVNLADISHCLLSVRRMCFGEKQLGVNERFRDD